MLSFLDLLLNLNPLDYATSRIDSIFLPGALLRIKPAYD